MFFSSAPLYLDPNNRHQHQQQAQIHHQHQQQSQQLNTTACTHGGGDVGSGGDNNHTNHQISIHMPPTVSSQAVGGGNTNSIKPGSMADRARLAKIPQPEPGLKCPRCQSTNTKFCYFNNYSLTQPRHFCKMCRRYWTKGGALRNVPVGGGFRKNNKRSSKKAGGGVPKEMGEHQAGTGPNHNSTSPISSSSNYTDTNNNNFNHGNMLDSSASIASQSFQPRMTQFPLMASLQGLNHHGQYGSPTSNNLGLNFGGMMSATAQAELGFQTGSSVSSVNADHQWTPNHFPNNFLAAFDPAQFSHRPSPSSGLYHFPIGHQSSDQQAFSIHVPPGSSSSFNMKQHQHVVRPSSMPLKNSTDQKDNEAAALKAEEAAAATCQGGMNSLSRSFLGMSNSSQYWNANNNSTNTPTWTDLSGISTTTQRPL